MPELAEGVRGRLQAMARLGVGATEAKSGYGLDEASESRMLEAIALAATASPVLVQRTFLGGHAVPPDDPEWPQRLASGVIADFARRFPDMTVDAFCERSALDVEACRAILRAARAANCVTRLHTDQFNAIGGVAMAVQEGARTVDHLEAAGADEVAQVALAPPEAGRRSSKTILPSDIR